jgi:hypothetical protein
LPDVARSQEAREQEVREQEVREQEAREQEAREQEAREQEAREQEARERKAMMFKRKRNRETQMDSLAAEATRSAALSDDESEAAIASPLFFSRIRASIEKGKKHVKPAESRRPLLTVGTVKLALSGFMIIAAIAFWLARLPVMAGHAYAPKPIAQGPEPRTPLTACSISAVTACTISTGDVLQLLLSQNIQELPK